MSDTSWEYIIPGSGIYNDTSQGAELIVPGIGIVNEGVLIEDPLDGYCWGEENPTENPESWDTWSDGAAGSPDIDGDADWGKIKLRHEFGDIGHGPVKDLGSVLTRMITVTIDKYGAGSGSYAIYIRGQATTFNQDDGSPSWELYSAPINKDWRYIQVKLVTDF